MALLLFVFAATTSSHAANPAQAGNIMDGAAMDRFGRANNLCAITFDDGPSKHTERLLDILFAHSVRATFFVLGDRAARNPATIQRMLKEGHEVANHTYSHKNLRHMPEDAQRQELGRVQEVLTSYGADSRLLRPPFGRYDAITVRLVAEMGMRVALWSADSQDWQRRASLASINSVYGIPARSGVILFHDTHKPTVDAMDEILAGFEAGQCRFVTMSEFLRLAEEHPPEKPAGLPVPPHGPSAELPAPATPEVEKSAPPANATPADAVAMQSASVSPADEDWTVNGVIGTVRGWAEELWGDQPPQPARY